ATSWPAAVSSTTGLAAGFASGIESGEARCRSESCPLCVLLWPVARQIVTRHLNVVPHESPSVRQRRQVPRPALQRLELRQLTVSAGGCLHQGQLALIREHDQQSLSQEHLTVTVAVAAPLALARLRVEADQDALVQSVQVARVQDRAGEFAA